MKESKLHHITDGGPRPRAAVVFVHGLGGDAFGTWKTGEAQNDTWPHWLAQDLPDIRVYSLDYDASPSAWLGSAMPVVDRATNALCLFELEDSLRRLPTIFVCHSLGGLLVKEALRQAETLNNRPWEEIIARTRGMVFLATPHAGVPLANYVKGLGTLLGLRPGVNLDELKANEPALRGLNAWYAQNIGRLGIENLVFFETRDTKGIRIVDETSADPGLAGVIPRPIDADHFEICKPTSRDAMTYRLVKLFLEEHLPELSLSEPSGAEPRFLVPGALPRILAAPPRPTNGPDPARGMLVPDIITRHKPMSSPWTSIFISHVYGDPEAELLLQTLIPSLTKELAPSHSSYKIICEREIIADKEWHNELYPWLHQCAAAIILISKQALDPRTPSVGHETFFLTVNKNSSRPDLCIIPILLNGTERYLQGKAIFDSRDLQRFRAISYPEPTQLNTVEELALAIADRLRAELPACNTSRPLPGLAAALAKKLAGFPETALEAAAMSIDPTASWSNDREALTRQLAEKLLKAEENDLLQAFSELCGWASGRRYYRLKGEVALALGAERLREEYAVPVAVEAALPAAANCRRPLLIRSTYDGILDLYITRAACQLPHRWQVFDVEPVLEFGQYDDLKNSVRKIVAGKFGVDAGNKEADQLSRAMNAIPKLRKAGMPVLLRLGYPTGLDPASVFRLVREISPELMVMYTNPSGKAIEINSEGIYCLLGFDDYDDLTGVLGALFRIRETAEEEL